MGQEKLDENPENDFGIEDIRELIEHSEELVQMSKYKDMFSWEHKCSYYAECIKLMNKLDKRIAKRGE